MHHVIRRSVPAALLATTALVPAVALAQTAPQQATEAELDDANVIVVTAQKRSENLQNVPISIQALGTAKLSQLNVTDFNSYTQQLPSVTFQSLGSPGTNVIYMRGVASGGDGNHSGSLPSVGVYLDEQPVTTVGGNLDVHIYDIARIESLSGPQGTLYGASSEAGTIRIITNKPDTTRFYGRVDSTVNKVTNGDWGGRLEGFINAPLSDRAALRVVGYYKRDAGYIDNVAGRRTFCGTTLFNAGGSAIGCLKDGISVTNNQFVKQNYNDTEIAGGRAALKVDLDDNWTVTPQLMVQDTRSHGRYLYDPKVGDLKVQSFYPEFRRDRFIQAALTIEGKIGNWDLTYSGAYLDRKASQSSDYTDYSEAYDSLYESAGGLAYYFAYVDSTGKTIDPRQNVIGSDHFKKNSQEVRIASPGTAPLRFVGGLFYQYQSNDIHQDYKIPNLGAAVSVNGSPGTLWLTQQHRIDRDYAAFGEISYDLSPTVTLTAGGRLFRYDNSLIGFFGFGRNPGSQFTASPSNAAYSSRTGVIQCFTQSGKRLTDVTGTSAAVLLPGAVPGSPCTNLGVWNGSGVDPVKATGDGATYRFNATWKPRPGLMMYGTVSRGFRPGGINRRGDFGAYQPDYLMNYELGFKTTLADGLIRLNGAFYMQDWKNFQFSFLGPNSFTVIVNGPTARIKGFDVDATVNLDPLTINFAGAYADAKLRNNLCKAIDPTFACTGAGNAIDAPVGTRLPITPQWKMSGTARYAFPIGEAKGYAQVNGTYQGRSTSDLRVSFAQAIGDLPAFGQVNLALGANWKGYMMELFVQNVTDERGQLTRSISCGQCTARPYILPNQPRTIGLRFGADF
ncbi:TonB-dependent receptor [Novosphingobium flavum]|uniref:TonB-dependent receptor n=1 Tax=Novosphingobium aerophilum TaxID=2839843 RepID=UPI00163959A7|nr:TonB-dependent receptor [Novosphingobium aerophilum]MBC2662065.1 TonB-dependent receptor [Novosphingobium aerophilum]